ncbi:hypothetical protein AUEXF2481DRAFT_7527 [Aureobasidium subglaciale EXF-2481]|uniref:Uncharacterized protein n=1 Tax=Aureobasidium subglaciale (strain EXF-2481) TaxID=1043005 RepID=A0A074YE82_AURSE|nr:uncharacterized protein AUEXF2481DRAFT_7527 [Aureobasidium subglaciale EXF-2481]KAI5210774.1 hypothetical protein E4T38_01840 [Aureobasidium subglaciale]KAI5232887.1 hypothetical protein E4T41_01838 [Aureobasidium subglaciale]KEQ92432.1 hypothetical protein AUEXF2481DRAFT_7527 [Aureobasidium subglaciale EXF-2481]
MAQHDSSKAASDFALEMRGDFQTCLINKNDIINAAAAMSMGIVSIRAIGFSVNEVSMADQLFSINYGGATRTSSLPATVIFRVFKYAPRAVACAYDDKERTKLVTPRMAQALFVLLYFFDRAEQKLNLLVAFGVNSSHDDFIYLYRALWLMALNLQNSNLITCITSNVKAMGVTGPINVILLCRVVFPPDGQFPVTEVPAQPLRQHLKQMLLDHCWNIENLPDDAAQELCDNKPLILRRYTGLVNFDTSDDPAFVQPEAPTLTQSEVEEDAQGVGLDAPEASHPPPPRLEIEERDSTRVSCDRCYEGHRKYRDGSSTQPCNKCRDKGDENNYIFGPQQNVGEEGQQQPGGTGGWYPASSVPLAIRMARNEALAP